MMQRHSVKKNVLVYKLAHCASKSRTRSRSGDKNNGAHVEQKNGPQCSNSSDLSAMTLPQSLNCSTRPGSSIAR